MVRAKKSLGQHFLRDPQIVSHIIDALNPKPGEAVLEIGPGEGVLTIPLLKTGVELVAVELDRRLAPQLAKYLEGAANFRVEEADILSVTPEDVNLDCFAIVGNLPYNITTPVLDWLLMYHEQIKRAVFMMQKEVAERVTSPPGRRARSTISVLLELHYKSRIVCSVPPEAFDPPPKIESAVVKLECHDIDYEIGNMVRFKKFVRFCFAGKRKNLLNNLNSAYPLKREELSEIITETCGSPQIRAEQIDIKTFIKLAKEIFSRL